MRNKLSLCLILIIMLLSLSGCYDATSIESSYYIVACGIDKGKSAAYTLSIQIAKNSDNGSNSGSSQSSDYTIYQVDCDTFDSGINILNNYLNKIINLSHCSAIIFSEELARDGLGTIINSLASNNEIRPTAYILISNTTAYDVLDKVSNSGENFSSRFYEYIISSANFTGYSEKTTFEDFASKINSPLEDTVAIYTLVDEKTVQNSGLAIFKDDKMIGTSNALDSIAHLILTNELKEALITIPNPFESNSYIDLEIKNNKNSKIEVTMLNNSPLISCKIFMHANIKTSGKNFDYTKNENIETVTKYAEKYVQNITSNYLYKLAKEYDTDVLEFQRNLSKKCLTNDELKNYHFKEVFKDSYFDVKVNLQIESTHLFSKN